MSTFLKVFHRKKNKDFEAYGSLVFFLECASGPIRNKSFLTLEMIESISCSKKRKMFCSLVNWVNVLMKKKNSFLPITCKTMETGISVAYPS